MTLHEFLDFGYGADGDAVLQRRLEEGEDVNRRHDVGFEAPLHIATRRRRKSAIEILLDRMDAGAPPGVRRLLEEAR